jgi:hypothetical protein
VVDESDGVRHKTEAMLMITSKLCNRVGHRLNKICGIEGEWNFFDIVI